MNEHELDKYLSENLSIDAEYGEDEYDQWYEITLKLKGKNIGEKLTIVVNPPSGN